MEGGRPSFVTELGLLNSNQQIKVNGKHWPVDAIVNFIETPVEQKAQ